MKATLATALILAGASASFAAATINPGNRFAYAANLGWMDWRGDTNNGAVIGEYVCSGYMWAANVGWIHLGNNAPANGIRYQNNAGTDFGVNHDGRGNLRGYAYGANIGWVNFETNGNPRVDLASGALSGYAYSANCGWISLSNASAFVQTDLLQPGADADGDGIADAWELGYTNSLTAFTTTSDSDGDGVPDVAEYGADTGPLDSTDHLRITFYSALLGGGDETNTLAWSSRETRFYQLAYRTNLTAGASWVEATSVFAPDAGTSTARQLILPGPPLAERYFRVKAIRPLSP